MTELNLGDNYIKSSFEHVPELMGWRIDSPEFSLRGSPEPEFMNLTILRDAVALRFVDGNSGGVYEAPNYNESEQGTQLIPVTYQPLIRGFLMGFPRLRKRETGETMLGIELCGDPNDIYASNMVIRLPDVCSIARTPRDQVDALYRLENELANGVEDAETTFMYPVPVALVGKDKIPLHRPMSAEEREALRLELPYTFQYIRIRN